MKIIETFTRHNKRNKEVNIREIKRKISSELNELGFLVWLHNKHINHREERYLLPTNWFVILTFEEHDERPVHQRVTLRIECFGRNASYPWREAQLRLLIKDYRLRRIENKQEE